MHANFFVDQWKRIKGAAFMQALEIAAGFPNVPPLLVTYGFPVMHLAHMLVLLLSISVDDILECDILFFNVGVYL